MSEPLKVLITDDEPAMRAAIRRALRRFSLYVEEVQQEVGLNCDEASTGEEALEKIRAETPELLLLDIKMPGMSGLEVLDIVSREFPRVLVVMITAHATIQTAVSATKQGAYEFLSKPFTPDELRGTIEKTVRHLVLRRQAQKLAEEKQQVRFEFISVLAHELKSPLNAVESNLSMLEQDYVKDNPETYQKMIDRSKTRLQGMRKLILDLLDMTRVESGKKTREIQEVDLVESARAAIEGVAIEAEQRGIDVRLEAPERLPLQADRSEIEIILNNLVSNAVKYNRDEGRVFVRLSPRDEGGVEIEVEDTGIGMSEKECAKLFNDFVRIKNKKTQKIQGSGLGLSIVRKLAQLYGGTATVRSVPDEGSTFTVRLHPAPQAPADTETVLSALTPSAE